MSKNTDTSDEVIVVDIVHGNIDSYEILMARYEAKLHRYVTYLIHDPTTARDVVQETFIKAYRNLQGFNPRYKFSSWIYRIAHNEAMNAVKKFAYHADDDIEALSDESYDAGLDEVVDKKILKRHVHDCLKQLEPKYRDVIQLVYFERMKYEEASDVLYVPASTIGVWLSRAKTRLKHICEQKGVKQ